MSERTCTKCGETKPLDGFYLMKARGTYRGECKACRKADQLQRPRKIRDPAKKAEYRRRRGEVSVPYIPRDRSLQAVAGKDGARHSAHVGVWKWHIAIMARREYAATLHDAHVRLFRSSKVRYWRRYNTSPEFAIKERLRRQMVKKAQIYPRLGDLMRSAIRHGGKSNVVSNVCAYSIADLKTHIEALFVDGMDWNAFLRGEIHIDHIKPQRLFDLQTAEGVRACWALPNLQPLWGVDNLRKGGSYTEPVAALPA